MTPNSDPLSLLRNPYMHPQCSGPNTIVQNTCTVDLDVGRPEWDSKIRFRA